ncbi:GGDEF domain-containing protein [Sphingomonas mesophila]|uniref:GGDEF domain-containing protein n=1 Tax=Sphingomonas mesophila TaxID=2303576 RepID=UPI0013C2E983|nr:GGDEF domain-containing protein [Sphingomonas mesophila]
MRDAEPDALMSEIQRLKAEIERLESRVEQLDEAACMDTLVPAANRRGLMKALSMLLARHERHLVPAAILFVDVDGLKRINDAHGHAAGDAALIHLTRLMTDNLRKTDMVARIGGDEFAVLLDHSPSEHAAETARRLALQVAESECIHRGVALELSVAIGLAVIERGDTPESVLDRADQAMYREKTKAA